MLVPVGGCWLWKATCGHREQRPFCKAPTTQGPAADRLSLPLMAAGGGGSTYVDHSIRGDAEEGGPLVHNLQLLPAFRRDLEAVQLIQGALERSAMLGNEVIARAEVI